MHACIVFGISSTRVLYESQMMSIVHCPYWTGFVGHPLCAGFANLPNDNPVLAACVKGDRQGF